MQTTNQPTQKKTLPFGGILLVLAGVFILLQQLVQFEVSGGIFIGALGLFFILWGASQHKAGLLIPGGILSGLSVGIFLVEDLAAAVAPELAGGVILLSLAGGFALITVLARLFTSERHWWALIVGAVLALIAGGVMVLENPNATALQPLVETIFQASNYLWALGIIAVGLWLIFRRREEV